MGTSAIRVTMAVALATAAAAGCTSDGPDAEGATVESARATPAAPVPMIVDYSPTLSDVPALLFLATHPDVDLRAVTLAGTGESDCEPGVRNTRALLVIAGHPDVPVACGPEAPMTGDRDWPLAFREAANELEGVTLPPVPDGDAAGAVDLLTRTLRASDEPVTIVTLGPLTNLGYAFDAEPSLAERTRSIVTMGGAFDVDGNVADSPDAEWNLYIDPASVRVVLASGAPVTFVPLDATNHVPGNARIFARLTATEATASGDAVRQLWAASLETERSIAAPWWYFWDELAATIAVDPSIASIEERLVAIDDSGATIEREDGTAALVASAADAERFERLFLETFAAGELPEVELTGSEERYLDDVRSAIVALGAAVDAVFVSAEARADEVPPAELAGQLVGEVFDEMGAVRDVLAVQDGAGRMETEHAALLDAVDAFLALEVTYLEALEAAAPITEPVGVDGFFEFFFAAIEASNLGTPFEVFEAACVELELTAYGLGAADPLCFE